MNYADIKPNKYGSKMKIVKYINCHNVVVNFIDYDYEVKTSYRCFLSGAVKCPYDKIVYGNGFIGVGKYKSKEGNSMTKQYQIWKDMLRRCYDDKFHKKHPTYKDCEVCDEWLNFQNFAKWYDKNYYKIENEQMHLDKDILIKGNKIYSPETCVIVPQVINDLFVKNNKSRGDLPIGVTFDKSRNKYIGQCKKGNMKSTKRFDNIDEAFYFYKTNKENYIKYIAEKYKNKIPSKLYYAMLNYEVEITD